ncbi:MAG: methylenetetrahydrofolate reductase [NAD(P)H] [Planctomycetota bacterium]
MQIRDMIGGDRTVASFEFFPPKTPESAERLFATIAELEPLHPSFVSVTYGAGGGTRELTHDLVVRIRRETRLTPMPHLTCVGHSKDEIDSILGRYAEAGIENILALRGDPPGGPGCREHDWNGEAFRYAAELVDHVRAFGERHGVADGRGFCIGVAGFPEGHPGCANRLQEMGHLRSKIDAGADLVITQLFFDNRDFKDFAERCALAGIRVPIIAGIMPVQSVKGMERMADLAQGARYPAPLLRAIQRTDGHDESVRRLGVHWATEQCRDLLDHGVSGLHFYTLNKSGATREIYRTLGIRSSRDFSVT